MGTYHQRLFWIFHVEQANEWKEVVYKIMLTINPSIHLRNT